MFGFSADPIGLVAEARDLGGSAMSTPTIAPPERDPADVAPAGSYHRADPVWVYRDGWKAGVIEAASDRAVTVTYRPGAHVGTGVDTFTASYVTPRSEADPALDSVMTLARRAPRSGYVG